jgi:hypothetical protein
MSRASGFRGGKQIMEDRRTLSLALSGGESSQVLLEAGSTVLVMGGQLVVRRPMLWLAENSLAPEVLLAAEQAWVAESGGWVRLQACGNVQFVVIPPNGIPFWQEVGRCLQTLFGPARRSA